MNELVSVGGVVFVAGTPENAESANSIGPMRPIRPIGEMRKTKDGEHPPKRKYRKRGERTRQEQRREAWRRYYREHKTEHLAKVKAWRLANLKKLSEYQRKYREIHQKEIARYSREYY